MNLPDLDTFWRLVAASGLVAADELARLRGACPAGDTVAAAQWLVAQGSLSTWQARRLARGDQGPFFIGSYRLMARVDAEGPGLLFRVREEGSGRRLQLRLLERSLCKQQDVWTGIVRRSTIAHAARSTILSKTIAVDKAGSHRFIVCEDIPLKTLADELAAGGSLPAPAAVRIAVAVARAVAELHQLDDVHGAITLAALRRESAREGADPGAAGIRLAQFPLAGDPHLQPPRLPLDLKDRIDALGQQACFVAPELAESSAVCTARSDIYAIGCLVHALVNGEPAGWQGDPRRTLAHAATVGLPPLVVPGVSATLAGVVAMMTARDPQLRYASAIEAADALAACVGMPPQSLAPPPPVIPSAVLAGEAGSAVLAAAPRSASMTISPPPFAEPSAIVPVIDTASPSRAVSPRKAASPSRGRRTRGKKTALWATAGLLGVAAIGLVALVFVIKQQGTSAKDSKADRVAVAAPSDGAGPTDRGRSAGAAEATRSTPTIATLPAASAAARSDATIELVASDSLPWGPPTAGAPPALAYLPAGSQLILLARPADLVADEEGRLFLAALGPQVAEVLGLLKQVSGCGLERIEELQAGWQADTSGAVLGGYAIRLVQPADEQAIVAAVGELEATKAGAETVHVGSSLSLWLPTAEQGRVIVCGAPKLVQAIVASEAAAGPVGDSGQLRAALPPDMERLVGMLDRSRHVTLLGAPHYLRTEGRDMLTGSLSQLVDPLKLFFSDAVRAAALSLHFGDMFYIELDTVDSVDEPARVMAKNVREKIEALADGVEDWTAGLSGVAYGKKLINRLPGMVRFLVANMRAGPEGRGVVVNAYLPRHAGHNIALAAELALAQAGRSEPVPTATAAAGSKPTSAKQKLQQKTSLSFPRDTLEKSIQLLSEEIGLPIEILGNDLKLEGITKNQSFGLDEKDKPAEEILRAILMRANPDGKLVYVVRGAGEGDSLVVTTRAAAAERGDTVPSVFAVPAQDAEKK